MKFSYTTHNNVYSDSVNALQIELSKNNYLNINDIDGYYGLKTEKAFKRYQKDTGQSPDGIYDSSTFNVPQTYIQDNTGSVRMVTNDTSTYSTQGEASRNKPFFNNDKSYVFRKGGIDILIEYSNSTKQKRKIEDVRIRSMSQAIDTSGQVIADVYQFVARDVIEFNN